MLDQNQEMTILLDNKIQEIDRQIASFVRIQLDCDGSDSDKISMIRHYVESKRKELDKFDRSLDWEDEE